MTSLIMSSSKDRTDRRAPWVDARIWHLAEAVTSSMNAKEQEAAFVRMGLVEPRHKVRAKASLKNWRPKNQRKPGRHPLSLDLVLERSRNLKGEQSG